MARCVVLGANGFLGSHLVDQLAAAGHEVTAFDRFRSRLRFSADVRLLRGDFLNQSDLEGAVEGQDVVFHFLSMTTPATVGHDPRVDIRTNVSATLDLLDASVAAGVRRFIYASSGGSVYGDQSRQTYSEDDVTRPMSPYGIGKVTIENYLRYYEVQHGMHTLALRVSNPYGPRQNPLHRQGLIPIAFGHILAGEAVPVYGDGTMVRDYSYVMDIMQMVAQLVEGTPRHGLYNLGSGVGRSVNEVLEHVRVAVGHDFPMTRVETPPTFIRHVVLDTQRFTDEFGTQPMTPIDEGIAKAWSVFQDAPPEDPLV